MPRGVQVPDLSAVVTEAKLGVSVAEVTTCFSLVQKSGDVCAAVTVGVANKASARMICFMIAPFGFCITANGLGDSQSTLSERHILSGSGTTAVLALENWLIIPRLVLTRKRQSALDP